MQLIWTTCVVMVIVEEDGVSVNFECRPGLGGIELETVPLCRLHPFPLPSSEDSEAVG